MARRRGFFSRSDEFKELRVLADALDANGSGVTLGQSAIPGILTQCLEILRLPDTPNRALDALLLQVAQEHASVLAAVHARRGGTGTVLAATGLLLEHWIRLPDSRGAEPRALRPSVPLVLCLAIPAALVQGLKDRLEHPIDHGTAQQLWKGTLYQWYGAAPAFAEGLEDLMTEDRHEATPDDEFGGCLFAFRLSSPHPGFAPDAADTTKADAFAKLPELCSGMRISGRIPFNRLGDRGFVHA